MEECIFCKIIKGEIPCAKIYEDENVISFLDIGPVNKGHVLVMPKTHSENITDIDETDLSNVIKAVKKVSIAVREATGNQGLTIIQNNFKESGQIVKHLHFHIIPRLENDGLKHWPQGKYEDKEMDKIKDKIISHLKN